MGYSEGFNGQNYNSKKIYGSEISALKLAESLTDIYDVYIFVNINEEDEIKYNGVSYLNLFKINTFPNFDIMIIVRYINYFIYFKNNAHKTFIWIHDTIINPAYNGLLIEKTASNLIYNLRNNINGLICLSDWHIQNVKNVLEIEYFSIHLLENSLDFKYYKPNIPIKKNSFIYMSNPDRGLTILLDCLLYIQNYIPDISLTVFRSHEFTNEIRDKLSKLNNTVIYGKKSQEKIAEECLRTEYFFYPTNFMETFCCCAAEAQLYHCVCIYNNIGGLSSTIADRGLQINYDINDIDYIEKTCNVAMELMKNEIKKKEYLNKAHLWAKNLNIDFIKHKWLKLIQN